MKANSIKGNSSETFQHELQETLATGFSPTLAIVFMSVKQDRDAVRQMLDEQGIAVYGATTNGEFIDEHFEQGTICALLLDVDPAHFFIRFEPLHGDDDRQVTARLALEALEKFSQPAFLLTASNLQTDVEEMISGILDIIPDANIAGGMAGDDHSFTRQYVFTGDRESDRAIMVLVLDGDHVAMKSRASHGWKPLGTEKTITKSSGARVYTIDNTPALDICLRYSGFAMDQPNLALELTMNCPFQLQTESGDPLMRPMFQIHWEDHSIQVNGKIPEGSRVRFSLPPDFDVIEKVVKEAVEFKATEMPEADALIIYNCGGRLFCLGPLLSEEIKGMKDAWHVPVAGMFSNAEIGRTKHGKVAMHNLTTCWVALKEK